MAISVFDLFSIGIGPSSSHTVGPMRAAKRFAESLEARQLLPRVGRVQVQLFGSLGATGKGHGTDKAIVAGLQGLDPETADPEAIVQELEAVRAGGRLSLLGRQSIAFDLSEDLRFLRKSLAYHSNALRLEAWDEQGQSLLARTYYSVGGGFVLDDTALGEDRLVEDQTKQPFAFSSANELLLHCRQKGLSISSLMLANELVWRSEESVRNRLLEIWSVMRACVDRGCRQEGILPGGLKVKRRAAPLFRRLSTAGDEPAGLRILDWVNLWALAVNEENAAGGRVVTAPTNGAAGIIPAVLHYYVRFGCHVSQDLSARREQCEIIQQPALPVSLEDGVVRFLLVAGAIGKLFKENASISGAEVGCQGEVGSACSMAAGGLTEVLGGTPEQVENAAEIAMEHNLGLTCDPIGGLVQVPCIERNAMAAVKAINASRMALLGDGTHFVSLDKVIKTMRETGRDMKSKYKETARGGLAVNVIEC